MSDPVNTIILASFGLLALAIASLAALKGWQGWLEVRRLELSGVRREPRGEAADLIEMADLRERVRTLESIASVIDLSDAWRSCSARRPTRTGCGRRAAQRSRYRPSHCAAADRSRIPSPPSATDPRHPSPTATESARSRAPDP